MADAAKSLGASKLIFGGVKKVTNDSFLVTLKLLDADRKQVDNFVAEQITRAQATSAGLRAPVQKWFATLTGQGGVGVVRVKGDVPGTSVSLDGAPVGVIGSDALVLASVAAGRHELLASKPGYAPVRKEINVVAGSTAEISIQMGSPTVAAPARDPGPPRELEVVVPPPTTGETDPPPSLAARSRRGKEGTRAAAYGTLGGSVASFALAIYYGLKVRDINQQLDVHRRFPCGAAFTKAQAPYGCNLEGKPGLPVSPAEQAEDQRKLDDGNRYQNYQYIAIGVGSALAVASGVLFYLGYLSDDAAGGGVGRERGGLRVLPMAHAHGGGVTAGFSF
jgi:hypothetical protein